VTFDLKSFTEFNGVAVGEATGREDEAAGAGTCGMQVFLVHAVQV